MHPLLYRSAHPEQLTSMRLPEDIRAHKTGIPCTLAANGNAEQRIVKLSDDAWQHE